MTNKIKAKQHRDGRSFDLTLQWLTDKYGEKWEAWRQLGEGWMIEQDTATHRKLAALSSFFDIYLAQSAPWTSDVISFFIGSANWNASTDEFKRLILEKTDRSDNKATSDLINYIFHFIEWVLDKHLCEKTDQGKNFRLYTNPFNKIISKQRRRETVHTPLPYRYICDLRNILCPKARGHFSDWTWAHKNATEGTKGGSWCNVNETLIDKNDIDCVWREKILTRDNKQRSIYQIWSPVAAMVLFIKLHLPLRTYQIRMLDSGEADTLRYENGIWINNPHTFALKNYSKGIFRQFKDNLMGLVSTGLYISTNKTSDQNKDEFERGYEIPWQNEDVLYWLEKLRNWQEKYNSINRQTDCTSLEIKHTGEKKSHSYLSKMGHCCFLFRDASARKREDRAKPIQNTAIAGLWYKLLLQLENNLLTSGVKLSNNTPLRLVHDYGENHKTFKTKTDFPLHSLRVSLITCYIIDAKLPLPVVSKLLAGHSRILMTVYYTKLTPSVMKDKMADAESLLDDKAYDSVRAFLKDAEIRQIKDKMAYNHSQSIESTLVNRNPLGWEYRHHGLCLAGGNTVCSEECGTIAGCWNGGDIIKDSAIATNRIHGSVPHGPENCVRCRWFITDARYLPALNGHLNLMSYKAHEAANSAVKLQGEIEKMEEWKYETEMEGKPFLKHNELQAIQRRYEKQLVEADEYTKDWIATFNLIRRLIEIEQERRETDNSNKLVAVGSKDEIKVGFIETTSELLHLSLLCDDAEIYPDILDDVKKTSAIHQRSQHLSRIMMSKGHIPYLLMLDQDQQFIAANAMLRQMALQANPNDKLDGFKQVANYLELGQFMQDSRLLNTGISTLKQKLNKSVTGISIKSLTGNLENESF